MGALCSKPQPRQVVRVLPDHNTMLPDVLRTRFVPPIKHVSPSNPWLPLLTPHQMVEINTAFRKFDKDGDGHIQPKEIVKVMKNVGTILTTEQAEKLIEGVDKDGNGMIEFDEFVGIMAQRMVRTDDDEIDQAFSLLDDGSGSVSVSKIKSILCEMGSSRLSSEEVDDMVKLIGTPDANGNISFETFRKAECWTVPQQHYNLLRQQSRAALKAAVPVQRTDDGAGAPSSG